MLKSQYAEKNQSRYPISLTFENFRLPLLSHLPPLRPPRPPWSFELHPQVKKVRRRLFSVTIWLPSLLLQLPPQFARLFVCGEQQGRPQKPFFCFCLWGAARAASEAYFVLSVTITLTLCVKCLGHVTHTKSMSRTSNESSQRFVINKNLPPVVKFLTFAFGSNVRIQ